MCGAALPAAPQAPPPLTVRLQTPPARLPPPLTPPRVCPAAASPQTKKTALHLAAYVGHAPCVEVLLEAGADASLKDEVSDGTEG